MDTPGINPNNTLRLVSTPLLKLAGGYHLMPQTQQSDKAQGSPFSLVVNPIELVRKYVIGDMGKGKREGKGKRKGKETEPCSDTKAFAWELSRDNTEAILGMNQRVLVPSAEVEIGGNMRGVVKLDVEFHEGGTASATGFLIDKHIVATAGHVMFDAQGYAKSVVVTAGLHGSPGSVESQVGTYVVVSHGWVAYGAKKNDIALIYLQEPLDTVIPMKTHQMPLSANGIVVGYPSDFPHNAKGEKLCKSEAFIAYNSSTGMVDHTADTEKGNSGGPVVKEDGSVIAIHRGWAYLGKGKKINQAVAIDRQGNNIAGFVAVLDYMVKNGNEPVDDNSHTYEGVDFVANTEGSDVNVDVIGEVQYIEGGLAFRW